MLNSKEIMKGHFKVFFFFLNFMWTGDRCLVYVNDHVIRRVLVCKYMVTFWMLHIPLNILYRLMVDQFAYFIFAKTYGECVLFSLSLVMSNFLPMLSWMQQKWLVSMWGYLWHITIFKLEYYLFLEFRSFIAFQLVM